MKRMAVGLSLLCVLLSSTLFFACTAEVGASDVVLHESGERIVVEAKNTVEGASLFDAMEYFKDRGEIAYEGYTGDYGFYFTSVGDKELKDGEFWAIYTSLTQLDGVAYSDSAFSVVYEGVDCGSALFGVEGLPLIEGAVYIIQLGSY
ncbi:MAG: hypothetical protein J6C93_03200 [Clostridia bacterium]|nr:hypothetical protein [Clostridia bacterium]